MYFDKKLVSHISLKQNRPAKNILQGYKCLPKYADNSGQTLLHLSAKYGNAIMTEYLIECGCNVNARDCFGVTPLMLAVTEGNDDATVQILLNANADIHLTDSRGSSALRKVIKVSQQAWLETLSPRVFQGTKNHRILKMIFSKVQDNFAVNQELTVEHLREAHCPLALVIFMNNVLVTQYLLNNGYPLNECLRNWSSLHVAVLLADLSNVSLLMDYGADVNDRDNRHQTPLFLYDLCKDDSPEQLEILKILLNNGASLTIPRSDGLTLMEHFFANGQKNTLLALVQSDTQELEKLINGQTPLHYWVNNKNQNIDAAMELLLKENIDINASGVEGTTALIKAVNAGSISKIQFLVKHGATVNFIDILEKTNLFDTLTDQKGYHAKYAKIVELLVYRNNSSTDVADDSWSDIESTTGWRSGSIHKDKNFGLAKLILKCLVIDEAGGECISESTFMKIESKTLLREYYDLCKLELQDMKSTTVYEAVTLYKLLTQSEERITLYARNADFVEAFEEFMANKSRKNCCYFDLLRKRTDSAIALAVLRSKASHIICEMTQMFLDPDNDVFYKIVGYMSNQDLHNFVERSDVLNKHE